MLISKFDLCKTEWLDLVFAKRNKEYGAYYLRQHYADNIIKAMGITFFSIVAMALFFGTIIRSKPVVPVAIREITLVTYHPPVVPPKAEPKKANPVASKPLPPVTTTKFVPMVVTSKPVTIDPPKIIDLKGAVGPVEIKVPGTGTSPVVVDSHSGEGGVANGPGENTDVHTNIGLEVSPEPYGGIAGWTKFLQKNLRYPAEAREKDASGRVLVSFIVEKDGQLSNITVVRGAGFGMDEEAARVLKLAPAWKPGIQNGQKVRVRYTLPINFSLGE